MTDRIATTDADVIGDNIRVLIEDGAGDDDSDIRAAVSALAAVGRLDVLTDRGRLRRAVNGVRAARQLADRAAQGVQAAYLDALAEERERGSGDHDPACPCLAYPSPCPGPAGDPR